MLLKIIIKLASISYQNNNLDDAKNYLLKTIEYNNYDIEAYKLLTKIYIKQNEIEEIITLLETRLEKDENGDLYYVLAQVYRQIGEKDKYIANLEKSIEENLTLKYSLELVKKELKQAKLKYEIKVDEVEEYSPTDVYEDDNFDDEQADDDFIEEDDDVDEDDSEEDYDYDSEDDEYEEDIE